MELFARQNVLLPASVKGNVIKRARFSRFPGVRFRGKLYAAGMDFPAADDLIYPAPAAIRKRAVYGVSEEQRIPLRPAERQPVIATAGIYLVLILRVKTLWVPLPMAQSETNESK